MALAAEGTGLADERVLRLGLLLWRTLFWQSLNSFVRRSFARFLQIFVGQYGDAAVGGVGHHLVDNLRDLGFQLFYELLCVVLLVLDVAEFLLPDARQFAAFQEFLADEVDEFYARRCGDKALAVAAYVVALEERLDDTGAARRAADAVLLHGGAEGLVFYELARRLHGAEEGGLVVVRGRGGHLLREGGDVGAGLAFDEGGERPTGVKPSPVPSL